VVCASGQKPVAKDEYQLREGQTDYGGWQDLDNENTFDWNLAN
jgi:hypothetical protein